MDVPRSSTSSSFQLSQADAGSTRRPRLETKRYKMIGHIAAAVATAAAAAVEADRAKSVK